MTAPVVERTDKCPVCLQGRCTGSVPRCTDCQRAWVQVREQPRREARRIARGLPSQPLSALTPEQRNEHRRLRRYGLTRDAFYRMLQNQRGCCAICGRRAGKRRLVIDHNHTTDAVRGLLCSKCNHLLGMAEDNIFTLQRAIQYLRKDEQRTKQRQGVLT